MFRLLNAVLVAVLAASSAYASINAVSLLDVQGEGDTALLIGATDEQKSPVRFFRWNAMA